MREMTKDQKNEKNWTDFHFVFSYINNSQWQYLNVFHVQCKYREVHQKREESCGNHDFLTYKVFTAKVWSEEAALPCSCILEEAMMFSSPDINMDILHLFSFSGSHDISLICKGFLSISKAVRDFASLKDLLQY